MDRDAFIAEARSYVAQSVRFRHQGRSRRGVDCAGLVAVSLAAAGVSYIDSPAYGRHPINQGLRGYLVRNFGPSIPADSMGAGDVALMRFGGEPCHVGIVATHPQGGLSLIHSYATLKRVVEHRIDAEWRSYIVEVFRP